MIDPVVINVTPPRSPFRFPKLPDISERTSKIITISAASVMSVSIAIFVAASFVANSNHFKKAHGSLSAAQPTSGTILSKAALPGGGKAFGKGGTSSNTSPVVTITAKPSSVTTGQSVHLEWSATKNPTSCSASDDWSGSKPTSGSADTPALNKVQTYLFTLTCQNAGGTGYATVSVGATAQGGTGGTGRPVVTLAANPTAVYTGEPSTLIWNATNSPTSCTASGDWSGSKAASGAANTPTLSSAKQYSYTLTCKNSVGTGYATATVKASPPPANLPVVNIFSSASGPLKPGDTTQIAWSVDNNPSSCTASGDWSGSKAASGSQTVGPLNTVKTYAFTLTCKNNAGSTFDSAAVQVIPGPPTVSLTASPSSVLVGGSSTLTWSVTNSPTSCTASGDWSGSKAASGSQSTGSLGTAKTYIYNLSCSNAGGTGYANNIAVKVSAPPPPVVSLSINPISAKVGGSATLTWNVTNNPSACTASGDWSGSKAASGSQSTGSLGTAKTYTYTLTCNNAGGADNASTSITVTNTTSSNPPVVTIAVNPTSIGNGSSSTVSWSATNSPTSCTASGDWSGSKAASGSTNTGVINTARTYTYKLSCSNGAGTGSASASLAVTATPVISLSVSPSSITAGGSATVSWSVTNNPSSCTAGGSWSGSKAASGSQSVSPGAGTYTYTLSCTNSGGTTSQSASLVVNQVTTVYCSGNTPCYGPNDLAQHNTASNCWGWNLTRVINITTYAPHHPGGTSAGSLTTPNSSCDSDLHGILAGTAAISGYKDKGGATKHTHGTQTVNNGASSPLASYYTGYYDPSKP